MLKISELCRDAGLIRKQGFYGFMAANLIADKKQNYVVAMGIMKTLADKIYEIPVADSVREIT